MRIVTKATAIQFINGNCHIKKRKSHTTALSGYYACFTWPFIDALEGKHMHTHTYRHATKTISRNQVFAAKGTVPGLNSSEYCMAELAMKHYVATYNTVLLI